MHHISTDEVFGSLGAEGRFSETTPYDPRSPYSASKAASDHLVQAWHHNFGLPVVLTNCSNNYGPWQFPEKLIPVVTLKAAGGESIPLYGDGLNVRDWLYVEDHVDALLLAASTEPRAAVTALAAMVSAPTRRLFTPFANNWMKAAPIQLPTPT